MKKEYDFEKMNAVKNPYASSIKRQITIRINASTINYFKKMSTEQGIPYQTLIDSYLTDCAIRRKKISIQWK